MNLKKIKKKLEKWLRDCSRLVILGIGNPLRGDDALGVEIIKLLRKKTLKNILLIEGGPIPENFIGKIKLFAPSHVLLIDAAHFGGSPGDVSLISPEQIKGVAISTHAIPLYLTAELIKEATGAKIMLLGVQPKNVDLGEKISPEVEEAIKEITRIIMEVLNKTLKLE